MSKLHNLYIKVSTAFSLLFEDKSHDWTYTSIKEYPVIECKQSGRLEVLIKEHSIRECKRCGRLEVLIYEDDLPEWDTQKIGIQSAKCSMPF